MTKKVPISAKNNEISILIYLFFTYFGCFSSLKNHLFLHSSSLFFRAIDMTNFSISPILYLGMVS